MAFNPDDLKPIDELRPATNPFGGDQGGLTAGTDGGNQLRQTLVDPEGRKVIRIVLPNGHESFAVETGSKSAEIHVKQEDGTFISKDWTKRGALETVLGDEKFMSFVAIASAGALASAYAGAGSGVTAGTGSTVGTGSGMSAGEIAALEAGDLAVGGGGVASNTGAGVLSSGAVATPVTQGAVQTGAGLGSTASTTADVFSAANTAQNAAAYEGMTNGLASSSNWWSQTLGWAQKNPQVAAGIIGGIGQGILAYDKNKDGGDAEALLDKRIAAEAAENDKQRAHASRNFQGSSYAKINWGERPNLTTEIPVMRNTAPNALALGMRTSRLGVLERESRGR